MTHFFARSRSIRSFEIAFVASLAALFTASPADARITRIEIDAARSQSPTFGGFSWPNVGQYEKIVGKAFGEVNPHDRQNRVIVDIEFAPRNARGNVEYAFNFYILQLIFPLRLTAFLVAAASRASASAARVYAVLSTAPEIVDRPGAVDLVECAGDVRFAGKSLRTIPRSARLCSASAASRLSDGWLATQTPNGRPKPCLRLAMI